MDEVSQFSQLDLGNKPFELTTFMRELGLNICTDATGKDRNRLIEKWGYYFVPENKRLKSIAYRNQAIKYDYPPDFMRQMVMSYFCAVTRYSSCLYWLRSLKSDIDNLRFYYVMAVAAIMNLNTLEILGSAVCKAMSVKADNPRYLKLLQIVGLPTIKEMTMIDAVATIRQVVKLKPEFFKDTGKVQIPVRAKNYVASFFCVIVY